MSERLLILYHVPAFDLEHSLDLATEDPSSGRGALLHAAEQLFADRGYEATTVRDISEAAGVSVATLHLHWRHKATLYDAVCRLQTRHFLAFLQREHGELGQPTAAVDWLERAIELLGERPTIAKLALQSIADGEASNLPTLFQHDVSVLRYLEDEVMKALPPKKRPTAGLTVLCLFYFLVLCFNDGRLQRAFLGGSVVADEAVRGSLKRFTADLAQQFLADEGG